MDSMTGFGYSQIGLNENEILLIEIKSINSRFIDIKTNALEGYSWIEKHIRDYIIGNFLRGKFEVKVQYKHNNKAKLFKEYIKNIEEKTRHIKKIFPDIIIGTSIELIDIFYKYEEKIINNSKKIDEQIIKNLIIEAIHNLKKDR